jgi:predicted kinase
MNNPSRPLLIIVTGPPATGKTGIARRIAHRFHLPMLNKDNIKERLFDTLGWKEDPEWSRQLNSISLNLLYHLCEVQLAAGRAHIVESNFKREIDTARFLTLALRYPFEPFQVQCVTQGEVLLERFKNRIGKRHPGHVDHLIFDYLTPTLLQGRQDSLDLNGTLVTIDTTDYARINYGSLFSRIEAKLKKQ